MLMELDFTAFGLGYGIPVVLLIDELGTPITMALVIPVSTVAECPIAREYGELVAISTS